jgi:transposase-like protein
MSDTDTECPRCESTNIETEIKTDIPGDTTHDYGCKDCLYIWDGT